ncbi:MAG: hypothetical protein HQL61_18030 [Magnetococcales bacterium]|nr:hypothetical protein [Nitrospirota bacterium]
MGRWVPIDESETQQEQPKITGRWVPVDDSAPTPKQEEPGLISKAVSAVRQLPADVWQKGAELAEEYLPESISPAVSGYARNVAIGLKQTLGGQEPTPEETQKATEGFKQTFGEYADIPAGFLSGYSANYTPQIHAPEDASTGHKIASGAAHMFGMGLNIAQGGPLLGVTKAIPFAQGLAKAATKWAPSIVQRVATTAAPEAITFGLYEGISKPDEGVTRMDNALHGLGMGAAFGAGRGLMVGLGAKAFPTFASALAKTEPTPAMLGLANAIRSGEKLTNKGMEAAKGFKLTPGEKTALGISDWATTTSLGRQQGQRNRQKIGRIG